MYALLLLYITHPNIPERSFKNRPTSEMNADYTRLIITEIVYTCAQHT